jgi:hypothetical protein
MLLDWRIATLCFLLVIPYLLLLFLRKFHFYLLFFFQKFPEVLLFLVQIIQSLPFLILHTIGILFESRFDFEILFRYQIDYFV